MKKLRTLAAALLFAGGVYANPVEREQLQHALGLQTTADQGIEVNADVSAKARKLANYTFERPVEKSHHIVQDGVIGAFARIIIDEKEYVLTVFDHQNSGGKDLLQLSVIALRDDGTLESEIMISDTGIDGNANSAFTRSTDENNKVNINKKFNSSTQTTEHKEFFQTEYQNVLDKLITFYEENTSENDEWTSQYFATRAKKLKDFLVNSEKGERAVQKSENYTNGNVRFIHNNKGYEIYFFSCNENHTAKRADLLSITVHSLENNTGRYLNLRDYAVIGRVFLGESIFYKTKGNKELLPDFATINESEYIQGTSYDAAFEETRREKDFFQAEYDKVLDELIEFYESE